MSILRAALVLAALAAPVGAHAASDPTGGEAAAMTLTDALLSRRPLLVSDVAESDYYAADAVLTLGALALAGGGLAALSRRPRAPKLRATFARRDVA